MADPRDKALQNYLKKLLEHKEIDGHLKELREQVKELTKQYEKSENDLTVLQSVGQIVGEVFKQLTEEKCIVKATNGPRYVVGCRQLDKSKLKPGTRVALDMTTLTIMRYLPREANPLVYNMSHEDPGNVSYSEIGGLAEQIRELMREHGEIDDEAFVKLSDDFNGADLSNVCTEAGMFAIRADHDFVVQEDFTKAVRKVADSKKFKSKLDYKPV
ncbi:26S protease regulatory subunit 10B [Tupaia chinensis]|uniref:26S protease regulatory subunit 10B n=1 Tax=Tupaia chinensis TaxID=246437 RepID=L9L2R8_TUPCH|nr:26S protease regulatory subunit 10B [Tupaia chinensis]